MSHHNLLSLLFPVASKVITLESGVRLDTDPGFGEFGNYYNETSIVCHCNS